MSKIEVNVGNSSTYNSSGIYVSDNTFAEIEDLGLNGITIVEDPEFLEIIGVFDLPENSDAVQKWYGSKTTQLIGAINLSDKITSLTSAERKKYDDHFLKVENNFKSSFTEIDNIKGRYFQLEDPSLLNPLESDDALNPYLGYFDGEDNSDWEGYVYSKNQYWQFLNGQNEFISAIGNSRKPPSIDGSHEKLVQSLENASLDRKWKFGAVNGSELAQACIQSIDDLVKSGIMLSGYDLPVITQNGTVGLFEALGADPSLGITYASQSPGFLASDLNVSNTVSVSGGGNESPVAAESTSIVPENVYTNFEFINYQILSKILNLYSNEILIQDGDILQRLAGTSSNALNSDLIKNTLNIADWDYNFGLEYWKNFYDREPQATSAIVIPRSKKESDIYSGFNLNHSAMYYWFNFGGVLAGWLHKGSLEIKPEDYTFLEYGKSAQIPGMIEVIYQKLSSPTTAVASSPSVSIPTSGTGGTTAFTGAVENSNVTDNFIENSSWLENSIIWNWNSLYSIFNYIVSNSLEKVYNGLLDNFGDQVGSLDDFKSNILQSMANDEDSTIRDIFKSILSKLPGSSDHFLETKANGRWNLISKKLEILSPNISVAYIGTPGNDEDINGLKDSYIEFRKMVSESTMLKLSGNTIKTLDENIFPPQTHHIATRNNPGFGKPSHYITPFEISYEDAMLINEGGYTISNNPFWDMNIPLLSGENDGRPNVTAAWRNIDSINYEIKNSKNKLIEFTGTTLSSELTSLIKQKSIDLGFIFRNFNKWNAQRLMIEKKVTSSSFELPAKKWLALQKLFDEQTYEDLDYSGKSILVVGIPFSKKYSDTQLSYILKVDGIETGSTVVLQDDDNYNEIQNLLLVMHGVDTGVENFPVVKDWNLQYYSQQLIDNDFSIFGWTKEDFLDNRQINQVDSRWNIFPFLFPEMAYSQMSIEKKYEKILYIVVDSVTLKNDIKIEFGDT